MLYYPPMARHSKWHNIQVRKGAMDKKRNKAFTKHAKLIEIIAREGGGDVSANANLRSAIDNARADNVPMANIERAVKKGIGELKDDTVLIEAFFEGYGPQGVAIYVQVVTDKRNRAVGNIKTLLSKHGGAMGEAGSVAWMFDRKGYLVIPVSGEGAGVSVVDVDALQLAAIDAGADDVRVRDEVVEIFTDPVHLHHVRGKLTAAGFVPTTCEITFLPKTDVVVDDVAAAKGVMELLELLEEDEDVTNVYSNFELGENAAKGLEAA